MMDRRLYFLNLRMSLNILKKRKLYDGDNPQQSHFTRSRARCVISFLVKSICSPHINTGYMQSLQHLLDDVDSVQLMKTCKILYNEEYKRLSLEHAVYDTRQQYSVWVNLANGCPAPCAEKNSFWVSKRLR